MKIFLIICLAFFVMSCQSDNSSSNNPTENSFGFFVGTYTNGLSEGIYKYRLNHDGTLDSLALAAKSDNPSFIELSYDKKYLIAGNETNSNEGVGLVESYLIQNDSLVLISQSKAGGAHTCFIATNSESYVLAANYSGGNVGLLQIDAYGVLSELLDVQQHEGSGSHDRQEAPHAHSAWFAPESNDVIALDLGTNELWFSEIDKTTNTFKYTVQQKLAMAPEAGPRHLTFHPNNKWIYVINELNGSISLVMKNSEEQYEIKQTISSLPEGFNEYNKSADIHISSDGKFLYATNRGPNNIAIFKVNEKDGQLDLIAFESTRGGEPRNFKLSPNEDFVVVANQHSNNIVSYKRDAHTGLLTFIDEINAPAPICILFE